MSLVLVLVLAFCPHRPAPRGLPLSAPLITDVAGEIACSAHFPTIKLE
ncbi:hypothetical protein MY10362_006139 [Beauveria mimosiformis]